MLNKKVINMNNYSYKPFTKKKRIKNVKNVKNIWEVFDEDNKKNEDIECVYDSKISKRESCDICNSEVGLTAEGYLICKNSKCSILYKDNLDQTAEWRFYGAGDNKNNDPTRCGMPINPLLKESSFGCKIICNGKSSYEMRKIRRYTEWQSMPYKEKSQYDEFERIKIMANNSGIPKFIIDDALIYHKKISEEKTFRALNRDGIIAASIYISGRINNFPRTAKEIATIFHLDNTSATKGCKNALTILNKIEKNMETDDKTILHQTKPVSFIERYCSKLNINKELTKVCMFIAMRIEKNNLMPENTPHSVAAGIVYFIGQLCNLNMSKADVKNISEISEVTINKCFKKLEKIEETLVPSAIKTKYCN
jgi:transcription initiation factor TFIIB